jgi:hypothetical protein
MQAIAAAFDTGVMIKERGTLVSVGCRRVADGVRVADVWAVGEEKRTIVAVKVGIGVTDGKN